MIEETPNKQRISKTKEKKRSYRFKKGSLIVVYYPRLKEFNQNYKFLANDTMSNIACQEATTVVVFIAKQNRYMIIKGYATKYQVDIIEVEVENLYRRKTNAIMMQYYKQLVLDFSHIPPEANYLND